MHIANDLGLSSSSKYSQEISFLNTLSFGEVFEDTRNGKSVDKKFLKVSDYVYQLSVEEPLFENADSDYTKKDDLSIEKSRYSLNSDTSEETVLSSEDATSQSQTKDSVYYGMAFSLVLFDPKSSFLSKLPEALRTFIKDMVQVVKSQDLFQDTSYKFTFKELDLTVLLKETDEKLLIRVEFSKEQLKDTFFTEENNKLLLQALKKELLDDSIELEVVYTESSYDQSRQSDSQNESAYTEEDDLEIQVEEDVE